MSRFFADCKKKSHLVQELVSDTNKISTPFSPNPTSRIKKGEIEENASYYLLSAKKSSLLRKLQERLSLCKEHVLVAPNNFPPFPPNPVSSSTSCLPTLTEKLYTRFAWAGGTFFLVVLYVVSVFGSGGKKVLVQISMYYLEYNTVVVVR